jgi:sn-glycerol 3-phosphate transport system substrate-binding protein
VEGRRKKASVVVMGVILALAAPTVAAHATLGAATINPGDCPVNALKPGKQVQIVFWHQMQGKNEQVLQQLVARFETQNPDIKVKLVNQVSYQDLFTKYKASLGTSDVPDLGQFEDTTPQQLIDTKSTIPMGACVKADKYSLADYYPRPIAFYTVQGTLRSMPWNVSNIVMMFNRKAVAAAGLDPNNLPTTLDGLRQASAQIVARHVAPHGMALAVIPYINEYLFAKSGVQYVNNSNGRASRATKAVLATKAGMQIWTWWANMVKSGLAINTGDQQGGIDHLLALGNGTAAITLESSGGIGRIYDVLGTGQFPNVEFGVAPLPALNPGGGVPVGDGSLWIPKTSPEREAAAWKLVKFLNEPAQLATLVVGSDGGYIPIRKTAAVDPAVQSLYTQRPFLRVPFDQLQSGSITTTSSGAVIGDYQGVRDAVRDGLDRMLTQGQNPAAALTQTQQAATAAITAYNARVGAG